jgi:hypothetical protein
MNKFRWNGFWPVVVSAALLFAAGCGGTIRNQRPEAPTLNSEEASNEAGQTEKLSKKSPLLESAKTDALNWPRRIIEDLKDTIFEKENFTAMVSAPKARTSLTGSGRGR